MAKEERNVWDNVVKELLETGGMTTVLLEDVNLANCHSHQRCFELAHQALDNGTATAGALEEIPDNADAAHVTGYHAPGAVGMGRYNEHREGFVFSNGAYPSATSCSHDGTTSHVPDDDENDYANSKDEFASSCQDMWASLHQDIATHVLHAIERHLELEHDWFQSTLGPTATSSQWHLKRYVTPAKTLDTTATEGQNLDSNNEDEDEPIIWLPVHSDPSLISVVVHDAPGVVCGASMGLQHFQKSDKQWIDVPRHGHGVAVILVGSLLQYLTGGYFQASKHRVVYHDTTRFRRPQRMAATLFVRPRGTALLQIPPSPLLPTFRIRPRTTAHSWYARVSKNYTKSKKTPNPIRQQHQQQTTSSSQPKNNGDAIHNDTTSVSAAATTKDEKDGTNNHSNDNDRIQYDSGPATLRSSAHILKYSKSRSKGHERDPVSSSGKTLPPFIRQKVMFSYDTSKYRLREQVIRMLQTVDPGRIGSWNDIDTASNESRELRLEDFCIPRFALLGKKRTKSSTNAAAGGKNSPQSQESLSDIVANHDSFLTTFDEFCVQVIVPHLKDRLIECGLASLSEKLAFYYQRPPTLRLQPGPSTRSVPAHCDADYGHQDGEINFWMPLTDPTVTQTDLWLRKSSSDSIENKDEYQPLGVGLGQVASFHGTSQSHYVPPNPTPFTRASLDFRVGVEGFFDPQWRMSGTKADHHRRTIHC